MYPVDLLHILMPILFADEFRSFVWFVFLLGSRWVATEQCDTHSSEFLHFRIFLSWILVPINRGIRHASSRLSTHAIGLRVWMWVSTSIGKLLFYIYKRQYDHGAMIFPQVILELRYTSAFSYSEYRKSLDDRVITGRESTYLSLLKPLSLSLSLWQVTRCRVLFYISKN